MLLGRTLWPLRIVGREVDDELYMIQKIGACQINHHYNSLYIEWASARVLPTPFSLAFEALTTEGSGLSAWSKLPRSVLGI